MILSIRQGAYVFLLGRSRGVVPVLLRNLVDDVCFDLPGTGIQLFGPVTDGSYQIYMIGNGVASFGAGCSAAQQFAAAYPAEVIDPLQYAYSNRTYTPDRLCRTAL